MRRVLLTASALGLVLPLLGGCLHHRDRDDRDSGYYERDRGHYDRDDERYRERDRGHYDRDDDHYREYHRDR